MAVEGRLPMVLPTNSGLLQELLTPPIKEQRTQRQERTARATDPGMAKNGAEKTLPTRPTMQPMTLEGLQTTPAGLQKKAMGRPEAMHPRPAGLQTVQRPTLNGLDTTLKLSIMNTNNRQL